MMRAEGSVCRPHSESLQRFGRAGGFLPEINREAVEAARRMSPAERIRLGFRLFEEECKRLADEILLEVPDADDEEVQRILQTCLEIVHDKAGREYILSQGLLP